MLKKLAVQALQADLGSVRLLLDEVRDVHDYIGEVQLAAREAALRSELENVQRMPSHKAAVGLFFAGGPVVGSRGIDADFAGKAVSLFQDLVAKQLASEEAGELGRRGPVPLRSAADLLITNVVRGSVGIVLEEADMTDTFVDTELKTVVDHVLDTISAAAAPAQEDFEALLESMDPRFLRSLSELFGQMEDRQAVVRFVEDERELDLDRAAILRARERASAAQIDDDDIQMSGRLFLLPTARRFELNRGDGDAPIVGAIARGFSRDNLSRFLAEDNHVGQRWVVRLHVRRVTRPNRPVKEAYTLVGLVSTQE